MSHKIAYRCYCFHKWLVCVCVCLLWGGNYWRSERLSMFRHWQSTLFPVCDIVHWLVRWRGFVMTGKYSDCVPQLSSSAVSPAVFVVAVVFCQSAQQMSLCQCWERESIRTCSAWDLGLLSSVTPLFLPHFCRFIVRGPVRKSVPVACNILAKERCTDCIRRVPMF